VREALEGVIVDEEQMRANLELMGGALMTEALTTALAAQLGRPDAFRLVQSLIERAGSENTDLRSVALVDERVKSVLTPEEIDRAFDPLAYLGSTETFIDRALAEYRDVQASVRD